MLKPWTIQKLKGQKYVHEYVEWRVYLACKLELTECETYFKSS